MWVKKTMSGTTSSATPMLQEKEAIAFLKSKGYKVMKHEWTEL